MSLLRVKAKVLLTSEEGMEMEGQDMGIVVSSKNWVWRQQALIVGEIYKVTAYSKGKSLIQMYDGESILVEEMFDTLCNRWEQARIEDVSYSIFEDINEEGGYLEEPKDN